MLSRPISPLGPCFKAALPSNFCSSTLRLAKALRFSRLHQLIGKANGWWQREPQTETTKQSRVTPTTHFIVFYLHKQTRGGLLNRNCSSQNKPNSSWCVWGDEHSNPGGGKAEVVRTGRGSGVFTARAHSASVRGHASPATKAHWPSHNCLQTSSEYFFFFFFCLK